MRERDTLLPVWVLLLETRDPTDESRSCHPEVPAWLLAAMPDFATVGADGLVVPGARDGVRIEVPICLPEFVFVELERVLLSFLVLGVEGVRAVIELPMREVRPRLILLFELPPETDEDDLFVPVELPMREVMPELRRLPALLLDPVFELDREGVRAVIELPMRDVRPRLIRLFELRLDTDEGGLFVPIELPMREVTPELTRLLALLLEPLFEPDTEGVRAVMELPMRDVRSRLIRLFELLPERDEDELALPTELPMRDVRPELTLLLELRFCLELAVGVLGALLEFDTEGVLPMMELPMREVRLRLMPLPRLFPRAPAEFAADGVRLMIELPGFSRELADEGAREVTDRLEMLGPRLRVELSELDREEIDVRGLTVLTELLRPIDVERLGLLGGRIERELMLLLRFRLITAEELRPRLAIEGALTRGAGALALGAGRLAELLLPEFVLFPSFFAAKTGSHRRIRVEMSVRIPILTALWYSNANMICLLSANGPDPALVPDLS